ncbi:NADH-quinone oxidoreductase subunit M [Roseisolibacter sp. H3M3-2]|uniref:complex I subunit 4 family protein n=1 Tax=Roseisolibacter sp. H3M3-2 TaxID=3031323 RepID=UPI0023DAE860|nr:NADH-quinone oxidoreductase subunit M [Roseisolibacter sp. H3M3-2]MDF1501463.1 NADH-quinone oxidoreductase subunit M [Roseisolibacter sp. H3M3-2]
MRDVLAALRLDAWVLPALMVWPLLGALLIFMFGRTARPGAAPGFAPWRDVRVLTMIVLIGEALMSVGLWAIFDPGVTGWQARIDLPWIPEWGAGLTLGVDGISLVMVLLTTLLMPLAVLASWDNVRSKVRSYYGLLLILMSGTLGVFLALDLLLFYVCWELVLIPMYFMIGISGGRERARASHKYFLAAFIGSLLMLVSIIALWVAGGSQSFNLDALLIATRGAIGQTAQTWLFLGFFTAFAVKSAFFPFHTWLPDAQHEAPTSGAVALGIKVGTYGILRFALPFFPAAALDPTLRLTIIGLAVAGIIYGALVAMVQPDFKKLVSYASVSHLGFVVLGIFALTVQSIQGAMMVMIGHGVSIGALFLLVGMLQDRSGTGMIQRFGGIARVAPLFAASLTVVALSTIGLPGTNGFVGEFLVLIGAYGAYPIPAVLATTGVILAAVYLLWALQRVIFNPRTADEAGDVRDLDRRELVAMVGFVVAILWLGIAPGPVLRRIEGPAQRIVEQVTRGAETAAAAPPTAALP